MRDTYAPARLESSKIPKNVTLGQLFKICSDSVKNGEAEELIKRAEASHKRIREQEQIEIRKAMFRAYTGLTGEQDQEKSFEKIIITSQEMQNAVDFCQAWEPSLPFGVFVAGKPGNGKTHLMKAIAIKHASKDLTFRFRTVSDVMNYLKDWDNKEFNFNQLIDAEVLVLDDLGTEKATEFEQEQLFRILEKRKTLGKHIFMTSNLTSSEIREKYNPRIVSRLSELMAFHENKAESWRSFMFRKNQDEMLKRVNALKKR